jgi:flagellar M-ring protein FliF
VPAEKVHETRLKLASAGLPKSGNVGFELIDNQKFGATQFQEQINYQRALEGELTKTIVSLGAVQAARVHLAIPKPSIFMREQMKPTASVLLTLYPGKTLDRGQVAGIMHLVSSSLPDLSTKNVSVVDQNGTLLSPQSEAGAGQLDPTQLTYVQQVEQGYIKRIMEILTPLYGADNVRAQVTADIDFNQTELTSENFKPNQKQEEAVIRSQQVSEASGGGAGASGVPGALSNQPPGAASAPVAGTPTNPAANGQSGAAGAQSRRESVTNYEIDKTVRHVRNSTGAVRRLSAAIVINHKKPVPGDKGAEKAAPPKGAPPQPVALTQEELAKVDALVKEAIGFSKDRGDSINVVNAPFTPREVEVVPEPPLWKQPDNVALMKDAAKYALLGALALWLFLTVVRPMLRQIYAHRPPEAEPDTQDANGEGAPQQEGNPALPALPSPLDNARAIAKQDPKIVANVVRNWVSGNE